MVLIDTSEICLLTGSYGLLTYIAHLRYDTFTGRSSLPNTTATTCATSVTVMPPVAHGDALDRMKRCAFIVHQDASARFHSRKSDSISIGTCIRALDYY